MLWASKVKGPSSLPQGRRSSRPAAAAAPPPRAQEPAGGPWPPPELEAGVVELAQACCNCAQKCASAGGLSYREASELQFQAFALVRRATNKLLQARGGAA